MSYYNIRQIYLFHCSLFQDVMVCYATLCCIMLFALYCGLSCYIVLYHDTTLHYIVLCTMYSIVLYCLVLCCIVLYCTVLYWTVLCYTVLSFTRHCIISYHFTLYYISYCNVRCLLRYTLYYTTVYFVLYALYFIPYYTILYYTIRYYTRRRRCYSSRKMVLNTWYKKDIQCLLSIRYIHVCDHVGYVYIYICTSVIFVLDICMCAGNTLVWLFEDLCGWTVFECGERDTASCQFQKPRLVARPQLIGTNRHVCKGAGKPAHDVFNGTLTKGGVKIKAPQQSWL